MANTVFSVGIVSEFKVVKSIIDPTPSDFNYKIGSTKWVNTATNSTFELTDNSVGLAVWVRTSNESSGSDYITVIDDLYSDVTWSGVAFDSTSAKVSKWYIGMSSNNSSDVVSFTVDIINDESNQDFTINSSGDVPGCDVRVTFPSDGNANLEVIVASVVLPVTWKVVSKRLDIE